MEATHRFAFEAIGTSWEIQTSRPLTDDLREGVTDRIEVFDAIYSRFRPHSLVPEMAMADRGGVFRFPPEAAALFDLYDRLHAATSGAVDPLVGRDLDLLGYDADYTLQPDVPAIARYARERRTWASDIERHGSTITTHRPVVLDVGAAGKGLLVDIVAGMLRDARFEAFVVDAGGDLIHHGETPLEVGLEHPTAPDMAVGIATLKNRALCASGINRRAWRDAHHVLDARTGVPTRDVVATWAVATDAMTADGLATALFFVSSDRLAQSFQFAAMRVFADGRAVVDPAFPGKMFEE